MKKQYIYSISCLIGLLLICTMFPSQAFAQRGIGRDSVLQMMGQAPAFSIYKDNYLMTGTTLGESPSKYNSDIKFQFSFKERLQNTPLFLDSYLYLIYTQKSFWDVYQNSSPFAETNYNPGIMLATPIFKDDGLRGIMMVSIEHESNGRDSTDSRSWNYIGINYSHHFTPATSASLKLFIPFGLGDNPDLLEYIGYGEGKFSHTFIKDKLILDLTARMGTGWNGKGSIMTTLNFRPSVRRNLYWSLQWFHGYAESLIEYTENVNMVRFGITIKPTFFRIY